MTFTEFIIVYLSCGAPFAVEQLLSAERPATPFSLLRSAVHLIAWPVFLLAKLSRVIGHVFVSQKNSAEKENLSSSDREARESQKVLVVLLSGGNGGQSYLRTKELLDRYTGLASLHSSPGTNLFIQRPEIARISNHPSPELAAACLNRRNSAIIQKHLDTARTEFIDLVSGLTKEPALTESGMVLIEDFVEQIDPITLERVRILFDDTESKQPSPRNVVNCIPLEKSEVASLG